MKRIALLLACLCLMGLLSGCGVSADLYFSAVPLPTAAPDAAPESAAPLPAEPTATPAPATATAPIAPTETAPTPLPTEASPALSGLELETLVLTEGSAVTDWPAEADALPRQLLLGAPVAGDAEVAPFSLPEGVKTRGEAYDLALQHLRKEVPQLADWDLRVFSPNDLLNAWPDSWEEAKSESRKYIYASLTAFQVQPLYYGIPLDDAWYHRDVSFFSREETEELIPDACEICEMEPAQMEPLPLLTAPATLQALDAYRLNARQKPDEVVWMEPVYASIGTIDAETTYSLYWHLYLDDGTGYYVNAVSGRVWCDSNEPYEY